MYFLFPISIISSINAALSIGNCLFISENFPLSAISLPFFCPKMKNFAQVSVSKQNLDYNPKVMKKIILLSSQLYFPLCIFKV